MQGLRLSLQSSSEREHSRTLRPEVPEVTPLKILHSASERNTLAGQQDDSQEGQTALCRLGLTLRPGDAEAFQDHPRGSGRGTSSDQIVAQFPQGECRTGEGQRTRQPLRQ